MGNQRTWGAEGEPGGPPQPDPTSSAPRESAAASTYADEHRAPRWTFQRLRMCGLTTDEAGNLTAHVTGLRIGDRPWTMTEVERLVFLRTLVERGRLES